MIEARRMTQSGNATITSWMIHISINVKEKNVIVIPQVSDKSSCIPAVQHVYMDTRSGEGGGDGGPSNPYGCLCIYTIYIIVSTKVFLPTFIHVPT